MVHVRNRQVLIQKGNGLFGNGNGPGIAPAQLWADRSPLAGLRMVEISRRNFSIALVRRRDMAFDRVFNRQDCEVNLTVRADTDMAVSEAILICGVLYWAEWIRGQ